MLWELTMLSELRERTWQGLLDFTWRQWAQMGVSAGIAGSDRWAIDPEALILFTVAVARRDPRLFDETLDWLVVNRGLLSMQRLRNLAKRFPLDARLVGAVSAWAEDSARLREAGARAAHGRPGEGVPVFSPEVLSFIREPDPVFADYGYLRPRVVLSRKSREPDVRIPVNFAFQLRHLFGPGSRAEVMRILLTFADGPLDAARISDESGFAKRNVSDTLTALATSRVISARWSRNERHFMAHRDKWAVLLEAGPSAESMPAFVSWVHLLPAFAQIIDWLDHQIGSEDSDYLTASRARDLMERIAPDLETAGLDVLPKLPSHGAAYLPAFANTVDALLGLTRATS